MSVIIPEEMYGLDCISLPRIEPGQVIVIYTDDGPGGPCGQGMKTTCPHTRIYLFRDIEEFALARENVGRDGRNAQIRWCEVGNAACGAWQIEDRREKKDP